MAYLINVTGSFWRDLTLKRNTSFQDVISAATLAKVCAEVYEDQKTAGRRSRLEGALSLIGRYAAKWVAVHVCFVNSKLSGWRVPVSRENKSDSVKKKKKSKNNSYYGTFLDSCILHTVPFACPLYGLQPYLPAGCRSVVCVIACMLRKGPPTNGGFSLGASAVCKDAAPPSRHHHLTHAFRDSELWHCKPPNYLMLGYLVTPHH